MAVNDAFSEAMIVAATRCTSGFLENERSWTWSTSPPPVDKCFSIRFSAATKANAFFSRCYRFLTSIIVQKKTTQVNITNNARPRLFCGTGWRWQLGNMPTSGLQVCASTAAAWHFDEVVPTCTYVRVPTPASRYRMPRELVLMSLVVESRDSRRLSLTWR